MNITIVRSVSKKRMTRTLTEHDAWGRPVSIRVTWIPEEVQGVDAGLENVGLHTVAFADEPPIWMRRSRHHGDVVWEAQKAVATGDVQVVVEFCEVDSLSKLEPGCFHVKEL